MLLLGSIIGLVALGYFAFWFVSGRFMVDTDNAYVAGNIVQVSPQTGGTVISIAADDTDFVEAGQTLVALDSADAQLALDSAVAQLGQTLREVKNLFANDGVLRANARLRDDELVRVRHDLSRRQSLAGTGAIAEEEIEHAHDAIKTAEAAATAAHEQIRANQVLIERTTPRQHPNVQRALLKVKEAQLILNRTQVVAPVTGFVARRSAQPGQRVAAGAPLMAVIPLDQLWVDANFKESQLTDMRIGQPVELRADVYGRDVVYHGKLAGFAAGTGAAFSLLPPQNAAGNWIKVVQRLPVRVSLDASELTRHPLRIGLSMRAVVDTQDKSGPLLSRAKRNAPVVETKVYSDQAAVADKQITEALQRAEYSAAP
jgi:membrane fusion protein (multidrug efflux system)